MTTPNSSAAPLSLLAILLLPLAATLVLARRARAALARHHVLRVTKDGGPESTVWAHWLFEFKGLGSIVLLRFENGSRDAYHSHAFDCISWVLSGGLVEDRTAPAASAGVHTYLPSPYPIITRRDHLHKVTSVGRTWVLSFRGPWAKTWQEVVPGYAAPVVLESGRREVVQQP
jgi:hypothetical protein